MKKPALSMLLLAMALMLVLTVRLYAEVNRIISNGREAGSENY